MRFGLLIRTASNTIKAIKNRKKVILFFIFIFKKRQIKFDLQRSHYLTSAFTKTYSDRIGHSVPPKDYRISILQKCSFAAIRHVQSLLSIPGKLKQ